MAQGLLENSISFYGIVELARRVCNEHGRRLPSASQLHALKRKVIFSDSKEIKNFLNGRIHKKKAREKWIFEIREGGKKAPFYKWIITTFIDPVFQEKYLSKLGPNYRPGLSIDLPKGIIGQRFEDLQPLIIKKALCEFIDLILLYQNGLFFRENTDHEGTTLIEVLTHG